MREIEIGKAIALAILPMGKDVGGTKLGLSYDIQRRAGEYRFIQDVKDINDPTERVFQKKDVYTFLYEHVTFDY